MVSTLHGLRALILGLSLSIPLELDQRRYEGLGIHDPYHERWRRRYAGGQSRRIRSHDVGAAGDRYRLPGIGDPQAVSRAAKRNHASNYGNQDFHPSGSMMGVS